MKSIKILWKNSGISGKIEIINEGTSDISEFSLGSENCLVINLDKAQLDPGAFGTIVTVRSNDSFSFFARDVRKENPIFIKEYHVAVTEGSDSRTYAEIAADIASSGRITETERLENLPEENFESASKKARSMRVPTWLGIGRDVRMFEVAPFQVTSDQQMWNYIAPKLHHSGYKFKETPAEEYIEYDYFTGRGIGHQYKVSRWLEEKVLPILNFCHDDDSVKYYNKMFVAFEKTPLTKETNKGTDFLVADLFAMGSMRTPAQEEKAQSMKDAEIKKDEETVLYLKIEAVNTSDAPKYCFVRLPYPNLYRSWDVWNDKIKEDNGISYFEETGVYMVSTLNGKPFSQLDSSVLLAPGEKATYICKIPNYPIPRDRAEELLKVSYDEKLAECISYWKERLSEIASVSLPDKRVEEMMKAGFLHLDLVCFGKEKDDPVCPVVGVYGPIGTESTPIIQYIESMGDTNLARRAVEYFLSKQHDDGFIQTFGGYMSETGPALWNAAEHFKYSHDIEWLRKVKDKLILGANYIEKWMNESKDEKYRGKGYGMIFGKVADCYNLCHSFMLNATTYGGLKSVAEVLAYVDEEESRRIGALAAELKKYILESLDESFATSPVVPLNDGSWVPAIGLWPDEGTHGPLFLFANGGHPFTHGSMIIQDGLLGGELYMVTNGVLPADHKYIKFIRDVFANVMSVDNVMYSQPYYNQQPYGNILRGEVGAFLSEFYNLSAALADRETYTFWEHLFQASPHKTHEEGWFLMRCRWMLFMDEYGKFDLLGAVPRAWLKDGNSITVKNAKTRYGTLSFSVSSTLSSNAAISVDISLSSNGFKCPDTVSVRLPHPDGLRASSVSGGEYCKESEKVFIHNFNGTAHIELKF